MPLSKSIVFAPSLKTPNLSIVTAFQILIKAAGLRTLWLGIASVVAGTQLPPRMAIFSLSPHWLVCSSQSSRNVRAM